jgi:hypothetical protein
MGRRGRRGSLRARVGSSLPEQRPLEVHETEDCRCFQAGVIGPQLREMSFARALLIGLFLLFLIGLITGVLGPSRWNWIKATIFGSGLFSLFVAVTVPDHFLEEHLWDHILKRHFPRIFLWTFGALLAIGALGAFFEIGAWIQGNPLTVLFLASLVGLVPESGPHLVFVTLYAEGALPIGILIANSIVQDGHGTLPLLAESKRAFVVLKLINFIAGVTVGGLVLLATH